MIPVFECVGTSTFMKGDKEGKNIYFVLDFNDNEKGMGKKVGHIFTYNNVLLPKVGEKFKALYTATEIFDAGEKKTIPVLQEILVIK